MMTDANCHQFGALSWLLISVVEYYRYARRIHIYFFDKFCVKTDVELSNITVNEDVDVTLASIFGEVAVAA